MRSSWHAREAAWCTTCEDVAGGADARQSLTEWSANALAAGIRRNVDMGTRLWLSGETGVVALSKSATSTFRKGTKMKNRWVVFAMAAMILSVGAGRTAAQGSQGVGSGSRGAAAGAEKPTTTHSLNPIKWVKKDKKESEESAAQSDRNAKVSAQLQAAGLLSAETTLKDACTNFKNLGKCIAVLHASHNLGVNFTCLKRDVTGSQPAGNISSCATTGSGAMSLEKAIRILKPDADARAEAEHAQKQAHDDLKEAKS